MKQHFNFRLESYLLCLSAEPTYCNALMAENQFICSTRNAREKLIKLTKTPIIPNSKIQSKSSALKIAVLYFDSQVQVDTNNPTDHTGTKSGFWIGWIYFCSVGPRAKPIQLSTNAWKPPINSRWRETEENMHCLLVKNRRKSIEYLHTSRWKSFSRMLFDVGAARNSCHKFENSFHHGTRALTKCEHEVQAVVRLSWS